MPSGHDSADFPRTSAFDWLQPRHDDPAPQRRPSLQDLMNEGRETVNAARQQASDIIDPITGQDAHRFLAENMVPAGGGMMGRAMQSPTGYGLGILNRLRMLRGGNSGRVGVGAPAALPLVLDGSAKGGDGAAGGGVVRREIFDPMWINHDTLSAAHYDEPSPVELSMARWFIPARGAFQIPASPPRVNNSDRGGYLDKFRRERAGR